MNRFDDALLDLWSGAPRPTPIDVLRARMRRRRRRRAIGVVVLALVISAASVGVAASLGRERRDQQVAVSPTTPSTTSVDNPWCVAFSQAEAVARGVAYGTVIVAAPIAHAKLVSLAELLDGENNPLIPNDPHTRLTDHKKFWVVELRPTTKSQGPYKWGLVALDATTGNVVTANEGPSSGTGDTEPAVEPPYFATLPDHAAECRIGSPVSTSTTVTTSVRSRSGQIPNGPLSRALEQVVASLVPKGAVLADAQDIIGDPSVAEVTYNLPTRQQLHIVRERLTKLPGSPEQLIRDPAVDSLTRLSTGSQLLRIGHSDTAQQVILGRPNGTMINVILWTPVDPTAPRPSDAQRKAAALATLDWLTTLVEQDLDHPSSDIH